MTARHLRGLLDTSVVVSLGGLTDLDFDLATEIESCLA